MVNVRCHCAITRRSLALAISSELFYVTVINASFWNWRSTPILVQPADNTHAIYQVSLVYRLLRISK
jgi:hypothetical protein